MEALNILRFLRNAVAGGDASSEVDEARNSAAFGSDDEETDDEDSFFDLEFKSPVRGSIREGEKITRKDVQFIESPRDVFLSKNESKPMSPVTILRSTPKLKVFLLGFKNSSKCEKSEVLNGEAKMSPLDQFTKSSSKLDGSSRFSAPKCRVAEMTVPAGPVFSRDNSLRSKMLRENFDSEVSSEKSVPKYLKLIKPFYVKSSKKAKFVELVTPSSSPVTNPVNLSPRKYSEGSRVGSFKIATRNLVKIRSMASATVDSPPSIQRRDDSLLEQHDGIQGAILHCKKSYSSPSEELSQLFRSSSDPHQNLRSTAEQKRCSI